MSDSDNPGVRFPPALIYAAAVIGGVLLDGARPLPIGAELPRRALGALLMTAWALLAGIGMMSLYRQQTGIVPIRPATVLVVGGPYRFTRNPIYLGLASMTVAFGLLLNSWWPIVLLVPALWVVQHFVIIPEERYLRRRFGNEYEAYVRRVRRWL